MARKTIYCVQPFWRNGKRHEPGPARQFSGEDKARAEGERLAGSAPGVVVLKVEGWPEADCWDDPVILATHGDVPAAA